MRRCQFPLKSHGLLHLDEEPAVNPGQVEKLIEREASAGGVADEEEALGVELVRTQATTTSA